MRWISRLLRRRPEPAPKRPESPGQKAAKSALSRAKTARQEIQANWPDVTEHAGRLRAERRQNHFAEKFRSALEGGRQ